MQRVLINGVAAEYVSVADRGLHYGDGLFETIACVGSHAQFIEQHLQRMQRDAGRLAIAFPERALLLNDINRLLQQNGGQKSVIKLLLTRGRGKRGYRYDPQQIPMRVCMKSAWPAYVAQWAQHGIKARFCQTPVSINPALSGIKSLNRLENVLASRELGEAYDEGFVSDADGNVVEGTMTNVFAVIDDALVTPDLSRSGVRGIMREQVIACARDSGIPVEIARLSRDDLLRSQALFVCNSVIGVCAVKQLEQRCYKQHRVTEDIKTEVDKRIDADAQTAAY